MRSEHCRINRCGRPFGIGTHMTLTGDGRGSDQIEKVCEEHWQLLRTILPVEVPHSESAGGTRIVDHT